MNIKTLDLNYFAIFCAVLVALCWGLYGPALANARSPAKPPEWGPFKPYVFVGVAYLLIAVIGGLIMMKTAFNDNFDFTGKYVPAMKWGFVAGCLGALGALALTFALTKAEGKAAYVMPIVFGGAVSVNAISAYFSHSAQTVNPLMWVGMLLVAVGICLTAYFAPHPHPAAKPPAETPGQHAALDTSHPRNMDDGADPHR